MSGSVTTVVVSSLPEPGGGDVSQILEVDEIVVIGVVALTVFNHNDGLAARYVVPVPVDWLAHQTRGGICDCDDIPVVKERLMEED